MVSQGIARYRDGFAGYRESYVTVETGYMRSNTAHWPGRAVLALRFIEHEHDHLRMSRIIDWQLSNDCY
eukprot:2779895-Prymnesium_polylepis.1